MGKASYSRIALPMKLGFFTFRFTLYLASRGLVYYYNRNENAKQSTYIFTNGIHEGGS